MTGAQPDTTQRVDRAQDYRTRVEGANTAGGIEIPGLYRDQFQRPMTLELGFNPGQKYRIAVQDQTRICSHPHLFECEITFGA